MNDTVRKNPLPLPSEIPGVPGAEGWERMPAVVGTGQATKRIRTGQRLRVDGDHGIVTILG